VAETVKGNFCVGALLDWATDQLAGDCARLDSEWLLAEVLAKSRTWLRIYPEYELTSEERARFKTLIKQRQRGVPVAHLLGYWEFWGLRLEVSDETLIPRPDTEIVVEWALQILAEVESPKVADLGCGTGAIALAIAAERPDAKLVATDVVPGVVELARRNVESNRLRNVEVLCGDWFDALPQHQEFDLLVSNPPYIAADDPHLQTGDLRFEAKTALVAEADGLADIQTLVQGASGYLKPGGVLLIEHGYDQAEAVQQKMQQAGLLDIQSRRDYGQNWRATMGRKAKGSEAC